jgi:hypothetical protein
VNEALVSLGQVAGIGGIAVGAALFVFRDIVRRTVLKNLSPDLSYRLIRLIIGAAWSIAVLGMIVGFMPKTLAIQWGASNSEQNVGASVK